jgi:hypothetical protein
MVADWSTLMQQLGAVPECGGAGVVFATER